MRVIFFKKFMLGLVCIFLINDTAVASSAMCSQLFNTERVDGELMQEIALGKINKSLLMKPMSIFDFQQVLHDIFESAVGPLNGIKVFGENGSNNYVISYSNASHSLIITSLEGNKKVEFVLLDTSELKLLKHEFKKIGPIHSSLSATIQTAPSSIKSDAANFQKIEMVFVNAPQGALKLVHLKIGNSGFSGVDFFVNQSSLEVEIPDSVREYYNAFSVRNNFDVFYSE